MMISCPNKWDTGWFHWSLVALGIWWGLFLVGDFIYRLNTFTSDHSYYLWKGSQWDIITTHWHQYNDGKNGKSKCLLTINSFGVCSSGPYKGRKEHPATIVGEQYHRLFNCWSVYDRAEGYNCGKNIVKFVRIDWIDCRVKNYPVIHTYIFTNHKYV